MSVQRGSSSDSGQLSVADGQELARLLRLLLQGNSAQAQQLAMLHDAAAPTNDRALFVAKAEALFSERKRRSQYFKLNMFGEPAWDMLLALYIADAAGTRLSIGKLVSWIGEPQTTALRWIDYLEKESLITRAGDPCDRRFVTIEITDKGRQKLDNYLAALPLTVGAIGRT